MGAAAGALGKGWGWGGVLAWRIGPIAGRRPERVLVMEKNRWSVWISHRAAFLPARGNDTGTPGMDLVAGPRKLGARHGAGSGDGEFELAGFCQMYKW